jgi:hypothetical protein
MQEYIDIFQQPVDSKSQSLGMDSDVDKQLSISEPLLDVYALGQHTVTQSTARVVELSGLDSTSQTRPNVVSWTVRERLAIDMPNWVDSIDVNTSVSNIERYAFSKTSNLSPFQLSNKLKHIVEVWPVVSSNTGSSQRNGALGTVTPSYTARVYETDTSIGRSATKKPKQYLSPAGIPIEVDGVISPMDGSALRLNFLCLSSAYTWNKSMRDYLIGSDHQLRGDESKMVLLYNVNAENLLPAVLATVEMLGIYYREGLSSTCSASTVEIDDIRKWIDTAQHSFLQEPALAEIGSSLHRADIFPPRVSSDSLKSNTLSVFNAFYNNNLSRELYDTWFTATQARGVPARAKKEAAISLEAKLAEIQRTLTSAVLYSTSMMRLDKLRLVRARMLFLAKSKYPNFFNPASREMLFKTDKDFDMAKLPLNVSKSLSMELENQLQDQQATSLVSKTCKHYSMVSLWRKGLSMDRALLRDIEGMMADHSGSAFIRCKVCDGVVMCPHEFDLATTRDDKVYQLRSKYCRAHKGSSGVSWNCDICGEEMGSAFDELSSSWTDSNYNSSDNQSHDLATGALSVEQLVYFGVRDRLVISAGSSISKKTIQATATDIVDYYVSLAESKNRRGIPSNLQPSKSLIACVFMYACFVAACVSSKGTIAIKPVGFKTLAKTPVATGSPKDAPRVFRDGFESMSKYYNSVIATDRKIGSDEVKELLVRAYGAVKGDIDELLFGKLNNEGLAYVSPSEAYRSLWKKNGPATATAKSRKSRSGRFAFQWLNDTVDSTRVDKYVSYRTASYNLWNTCLEKDLWSIPLADRAVRVEWVEYQAAQSDLRRVERELISSEILSTLYPYSHSPKSNARYFDSSKVYNMNPHICLNTGSKHTMDTYIWQRSTSASSKTMELVEIKKKDLSVQAVKGLTFIDRRCSKCSKTIGELAKSKLDLTEFNRLSDARNKAIDFYRCFEHRCLVEGFHDWQPVGESVPRGLNNMACIKCKMTWLQWWNRETSGKSESWYTRNLKVFEAVRKEQQDSKSALLKASSEARAKLHAANSGNRNSVKTAYLATSAIATCLGISDGLVVKFSGKFKINPRQLVFLGNSEGIDDKNLEDDKVFGDALAKAKLTCSPGDGGVLVYNKNMEHMRLVRTIVSLCIAWLKNPSMVMPERGANQGTSVGAGSMFRHALHSSTSLKTELESHKHTVRALSDLLLKLQRLSPSATNILEACIAVGYVCPPLAAWIVDRMMLVDKLCMKYDYAELKKDYSKSNNIHATSYDGDSYDGDSADHGADDQGVDDLFDYNDLSMNNMVDDDLDAGY